MQNSLGTNSFSATQREQTPLSALLVSTRSHGIHTFDVRHTFLSNCCTLNGLRHLWDLSWAFVTVCQLQSWLTVYSLLIWFASFIFFYTYRDSEDSFLLSWDLAGFGVLLPLLLELAWVFWRRERALHALASLKSDCTGLLLFVRDRMATGDGVKQVQAALSNVLDRLSEYLEWQRSFVQHQSPRYLVTDAPGLSLLRTMQVLGHQYKQVISGMHTLSRMLSSSTASQPHAAIHTQTYIRQMLFNIEQLYNIKESRTPTLIRMLLKFFVVVFLPLFWGPYWARYGRAADFPIAFFASLLSHISFMAILNLTMALEDPFLECLDGVSVQEIVHQIKWSIFEGGMIQPIAPTYDGYSTPEIHVSTAKFVSQPPPVQQPPAAAGVGGHGGTDAAREFTEISLPSS